MFLFFQKILKQNQNFLMCSNFFLAKAKHYYMYGEAVYFFLAGDDLQQREWIFRSSVMGQEA